MDQMVENYCEEIRETRLYHDSSIYHHPLYVGTVIVYQAAARGTDMLSHVVSTRLIKLHEYAAQRDWYALVIMPIPRPYRLGMFLALLRRKDLGLNMRQIETAKIMAEIWTDTEQPSDALRS